jgi:hypothetical protein
LVQEEAYNGKVNAKVNLGYSLRPAKGHAHMLVYFIGMFPLGMWQGSLRSAWGDLPAFVVVVTYLLFLRLLGFLIVRFIELKSRQALMAQSHAVDISKQKRKKM